MAAPLLEFEHVTVLRNGRVALDDVALRVGYPEHVAIVGPNGAGKSTLLKLLTRECYPVPSPQTTCRILGAERWNVFELRAELGIVSNDLTAALSPHATVREIVLSAYFSSHSLEAFHAVTPAMREAVDGALAALGVAHLAGRALATLSSGELRRTTIARAFVHRPRVLIFDEPATSLDLAAQRDVRGAMRSLTQAGIGVVLVTHQLDDVIPEIERVVFVKDGRVYADGPKHEMFVPGRLRELFGVSLELSCADGYYYAR